MSVIMLSACAPAAFTLRKYSWYSFLLEADSTIGPNCGWKDYVNEKFHPATFRLVAQCLKETRHRKSLAADMIDVT